MVSLAFTNAVPNILLLLLEMLLSGFLWGLFISLITDPTMQWCHNSFVVTLQWTLWENVMRDTSWIKNGITCIKYDSRICKMNSLGFIVLMISIILNWVFGLKWWSTTHIHICTHIVFHYCPSSSCKWNIWWLFVHRKIKLWKLVQSTVCVAVSQTTVFWFHHQMAANFGFYKFYKEDFAQAHCSIRTVNVGYTILNISTFLLYN